MGRTVLDTPIGGLGVAADAEGVFDVTFGAAAGAMDDGPGAAPDDASLTEAVAQLQEYFAGERTEFALPLSVRRGSEFERAVWAAIARIPYGETRSYGFIAREVGDPGAAQAVGVACNRNPIPVIVPCHRVIGADGKLVGFGGGLHRKRWLLSLEARVHIERSFAG